MDDSLDDVVNDVLDDGVDDLGDAHAIVAGRARPSSVRVIGWVERARNSLAIVPVLGLVSGWLLARALSTRALNENLAGWIDDWYGRLAGDERSWVWFSAATFQTVTATVAAAMLTFIGVVFSLSILALQVASSQLSPRIMRTFVRSNVVTWTLAVFLATFVYSLTVLSAIQPGTDGVRPFEPFIAYYVLLGLVAATLGMFVAYVSHVVRLIRVHHILDAVASETRSAIERARSRVVDRRSVPPPALGEPAPMIIHAHRSGVVDVVGIDRLVRLGERHDAVLVVRARIGEHMSQGQPLVEVHARRGGGLPIDPRSVLAQIHLASERTVLQDPAFGLRQIVDVAVRALSPAVNDPTTAVQAIDRLVDLLLLIGRSDDEPSHWLGPTGSTVRLVLPARTWGDLVDLALTEIMVCGLDAPQVTRRLTAALGDLEDLLPDHRRDPMQRWRRHLEEALGESADDRRHADRCGLG